VVDQEYHDVEHIKPSHPGFQIRNLLMKNYHLSESDIAERMGTTSKRVAEILAESEPLTLSDARNLKAHIGHAAVNLLRLQVARDFFEKNDRRPNLEERETLFAALDL
jgi:plasmid maintenance system antidote protein VapI